MNPLTLVRRIDMYFSAIPYPGDDNIVRSGEGTDIESMRISNALKGRRWQDVSFETLEELRTALPFLSAEGYRFYLPAFMVISVIDFPRAGVIPDEIVLSLTPPRPSDTDRLRDMAAAHPEMNPFGETEWNKLLEATDEAYASGGPIESTFLERVSGFDDSQLTVIREFLEFMRDGHGDDFPGREPERALARLAASGLGGR